MLVHVTRKKRQNELDCVVFMECKSRESYSYLIVLVRDIGPDAVIFNRFEESEELWQSVLEGKNIERGATARDSPGGAAPSSQA